VLYLVSLREQRAVFLSLSCTEIVPRVGNPLRYVLRRCCLSVVPPAFCSINATALVSNSHSTRRISRQHTVLVRLARPEGLKVSPFWEISGVPIPQESADSPLIENFLSAAMSFKSEKYKLVCSTELNDRSQEVQSTSENDFECFASTGVNTPVTMFPDFEPHEFPSTDTKRAYNCAAVSPLPALTRFLPTRIA